LAAFERTNSREPKSVGGPESSVLQQLIEQLTLEHQAAERRRDRFRQDRDKYKKELRPLQDALAAAYAEAENAFVPQFRSLATRFIGIDIAVRLNPTADGVSILLEVGGTRRREIDELSESQRFFLDIALRMALAVHMSHDAASLLIDTPEGSLDIAYEARAGEMFAEFARANQLVITANINTSQLLKSLAQSSGVEHMDLVRMTGWTPLSEVQAACEDLFEDAYRAIEKSLLPGGADAAANA